ncbi:alpha/beta hydrolase [Nonomuraea sp. PA05]|uniref:alpha/beta hydrolase n=1 Tax=Nonomuraea sp. PA05 TaxID=2604466 RepID=UPI0021CCB061|nr:alpha/beta hydrolase [Nonomuraea sp. PA05]
MVQRVIQAAAVLAAALAASVPATPAGLAAPKVDVPGELDAPRTGVLGGLAAPEAGVPGGLAAPEAGVLGGPAAPRAGVPGGPAGSVPVVPVWRGCGHGLECAKLSVPVDWARPRGRRTEIDLARMPARDPYGSLGPLVVSTGSGPVIQGVRARPDAVSELARWFDVVFVETRGIGDHGSAATVRCSVPQPDPRRLQLTPGAATWRAYARDNAAYDRSCRIAAGPAYAGLTSWQVAHDLDAVRAALGQPRLRYFGNAYGSVYGQAYLELYPRRVERMYLEGVPDHGQTSVGRRLIAHARAAERQLAAFRAWCAGRMGCPLGGDDAVKVLDGLLERAPLAAGPGRRVDGREVVVAVLAGLVPQRWPELAGALAAAEAGDASGLAAMAAPGQPVAPAMVTRALHCHDFMPVVPGYRRFLAMESRLRTIAPRVGWLTGRHEVGRCLGIGGRPGWPPRTGALGVDGLVTAGRGGDGPSAAARRCEGAPAAARGGAASPGAARGGADAGCRSASRAGKGPAVLVGIGRLDTESPASGAARVAGRIPGAAVLWHGDGHGAYLQQGAAKLRATCLRSRVHDFLVNGTPPRARTRCPGELTVPLR